VLDRATTDLEAGVREADFVLLAAPVLTSEGLLARVWRAAPEGAVVTDVVAVVDREEGGKIGLAEIGVRLHALVSSKDLLTAS